MTERSYYLAILGAVLAVALGVVGVSWYLNHRPDPVIRDSVIQSWTASSTEERRTLCHNLANTTDSELNGIAALYGITERDAQQTVYPTLENLCTLYFPGWNG